MTNSTISYKGYTGTVEFSEPDQLFWGKILGVKAHILYEGKNAEELMKDFHDAIDDYIELCERQNKQPEKPYKGTFNIRISPELHRDAALLARERRTSLNSIVEEAIRCYLANPAQGK